MYQINIEQNFPNRSMYYMQIHMYTLQPLVEAKDIRTSTFVCVYQFKNRDTLNTEQVSF